MVERISIFIDGNNMFYAQQKNGWYFDPRLVRDYFASQEDVKITGLYWYTGLKGPEDQRNFRDALMCLGYNLITKVIKEYYDDRLSKYSQKANLDNEICVDMLSYMETYDTAVLFSGDGDFEYLLRAVRARGKRIVVVSTEGMVAREARNACNAYIDLNDIREFIEKPDRSIQEGAQ